MKLSGGYGCRASLHWEYGDGTDGREMSEMSKAKMHYTARLSVILCLCACTTMQSG